MDQEATPGDTLGTTEESEESDNADDSSAEPVNEMSNASEETVEADKVDDRPAEPVKEMSNASEETIEAGETNVPSTSTEFAPTEQSQNAGELATTAVGMVRPKEVWRKGQVAKLEKEVTELKDQITELEKQIMKLKQQSTEHEKNENQATELEVQFTEHEKQIPKLKQQITESKEPITELRQQITELNAKHKSIQVRLTLMTTLMIIFAILVAPQLLLSLAETSRYLKQHKPDLSDSPHEVPPSEAKKLENKFTASMQQLRNEFPAQTSRLWAIIQAATLPIITEDDPMHPAVVLLVAVNSSRPVGDCLAKRYAQVVTDTFGAFPPPIFDSKTSANVNPDFVKREIDQLFSTRFEGNSRAGVVLHLENLDGTAAMIFYRFCDNDNAPFKKVAVILTLTLQAEDAGNERDSVAFNELRRVWGSSLDADKLEPLLSRIGNSVAFVRPEPSEVLKKLGCTFDYDEL